MVSAELRLQPDALRYTLPRFLDDVAERYGARVALRFEGRDVTYLQLREEARRLAKGVVAAGVVKGARVALLMSNRPEWLSAAFAVAMTGAVLVPVNTYAAPDERDFILRHGDASVLLLQPALAKHAFAEELLARHGELAGGAPGRLRCAALPQLRRIFCLELEATRGGVEPWSLLIEGGAGESDALLDSLAGEVTPSDDALLIYTSGTTARPKGVLHRQRAPVIQSWRFADLMRLAPGDRVFTAQPFFWTAGIAMSLGATLAAGATLLLQEIFEPGEALALIERERATTVHAWPHQDKSMAEHPTAGSRDLRSLRNLEFSSPLAKLAGIEKDEWGIYGSYGLSETFTLASAFGADAPAALRHGTNGPVLRGNAMRVVDPHTGAELPPGQKGEIAVKGLTFMAGYHKVEPENYLDAEGYFRTQDGGFFDADGNLHWRGRLSNLIKTGGANVSPLEIEEAMKSYPGAMTSVALGVPHPTLGEVIVLCVVPAGASRAPDAEAIRAFLRERIASYKVPRAVFVFAADEVAYTGTQKLQLDPLRAKALERLAAARARIAGHVYGT